MWDENKVRIIDIANDLGVSTATVSNVLHGKTKKISDATIKRVEQKLEESGYIPNMAATLLARNNSRIIGVVVNNHEKYEGRVLEDPFISSAINYLSDEIENAGYFMMLKKAKEIMDAVRFSSMWNLDGLIIIGFCENEYKNLRDHIRIPFVGISDNNVCMDLDRFNGLNRGLGKDADFLMIPMSREKRQLFYQKNLEKIKKYTAIFAVSDYYAIDIMVFLKSCGISVPEDISVVGFDGSSDCQRVVPVLTSVYQNNELRAKMAMELLLKMLQDSSFSQSVCVPVKLVWGESVRNLCESGGEK